MKKKNLKYVGIVIFLALIILAICNIYTWIVSGEQNIKISTSDKAYTNSELYLSIIAQENGVDLETKNKIKLLDSKGKKVKDAKVTYDGNNAIIDIPEVESGNYFIQAKVSSSVGIDTIEKSIYISDGNAENVTISLDKGIYKPGDTVNFRALLTDKKDDEPKVKETNICIYDGNDNKVYNENATTSDYGILSGAFTLANEVNSGIYKLVVKTNTTETTKQFKVNPYVTPKYETKIDFDKQNYLVGDTATINIKSNYFFGEAVSNAKYMVYIDDKEYQTITANEEGIASINYKIEKAKTYSIKVEAVDTSNYFVETTSSFVAGTDLFEIELLPEYNSLIAGEKNEIYVFTKKADGTPLKTYITVTSDKYTKQVATDENGIGKFTIDIDFINSYTNITAQTKIFNVVAENMNGEKVEKHVSLKIENRKILLSTDKSKYNQGEDIKINLTSNLENTRNIYFFKNDKLIKMLSTESEETTINLGDEYGLIDIYITQNNSTNYYATTNSYKRTIFIKPAKALNIQVSTDKQEYKPGENISILFNTNDENDNSVEAALLVSMLDNSILSLADNDLSIDNIKLALSDITFSGETDAATLYSCIIDDNSEQTMMGLLLKQGNKNINVSEITTNNREQEQKSAVISVISIILIIVISLTYFSVRFSKFRNVLKHVLNYAMITLAFVLLVVCIISEFFWEYIDYPLWIIGISAVISLALYITWIYKLSNIIFRTSLSLIFLVISIYMLVILTEIFEIPFGIFLIIFALIILALAIVSRLNEMEKIKLGKIMQKITKGIISIGKFIGALILASIIGLIVEKVTDVNGIANAITIIVIYLLNYLFNKNSYKKITEKESDTKNIVAISIISLFVVLGLIAFLEGVIFKFASGLDATQSAPNMDIEIDEGTRPPLTPGDFITNSDTMNGSSGATKGPESFWGNLGESFLSTDYSKNESNLESSSAVKNEIETTVDENIRNVFLESMCFIPELITNNGTANLDLTLSDNITTWTIQTIGNTRDGRVGYGMIDTVKVFKDFFVDFELPKNSVSTDKISIPVTVYNYTNKTLNTTLKIQEAEWFSLQGKDTISLNVEAEKSKMVYIPINIIKSGNFKFRVEVTSESLVDIVEKEIIVSPKGYKVEKVVSTGVLDEDISEDILILEDIVENSASAKVKIYGNTMSQTVEGMENIFKMPTGCFEQVSSSLYPNILALKYLEENDIVDEEIRSKAMNYISSGYQKLLTYEVKGESGGFSLYGHSPAETVLTAYGLMELTDLKEVYNVDENVIERMNNFLYKKQNANGSFTITGSHVGGAGSREKLALNAYIIWALSESDPNNEKLEKSINYLKNELNDVDDNYTLALIANALANVEDKETEKVIKRLVNNVNIDGNNAYITSAIRDYYGTRSNVQTVQTVALTSMALSKTSKNISTNKALINYLIAKKDTRGTWYSTQATILALKALNEMQEKAELNNQTIIVKINSEEQKIEIKDNSLDYYQLIFNNLSKENKLSIDIEKGKAYYEVVEEYYIPYENVKLLDDNIEISVEANTTLNVNEILQANIKLINRSDDAIYNGMVTISIPQGFVVNEESLMLLENKGIIEKYETSYTNVNLYLRNFEIGQIVDFNVKFRAAYPVDITGLEIRAYDYYNPEVEGKNMPINIIVKD